MKTPATNPNDRYVANKWGRVVEIATGKTVAVRKYTQAAVDLARKMNESGDKK